MSRIAPNNKCEILINDFIDLAKRHLATIQGQATTTSTTIVAGAPVPSVALWQGYICDPEEPDAPTKLPDVVPTQFSSQKDLSFVEQQYYKEELTQFYAEQYPTDVYSAPIYGTIPKTANTSNTVNTSFVASGREARTISEAYLGRALSDEEWNTFIALIYAEAGRNQKEEAHVGATILNRLRYKFTPAGIANNGYKYNTLMDIAWQWRQYEAVTGNPANGNKPSKNFIEGPSKYPRVETGIYGALVNFLPSISKDLTDFTSNNDCLYVECKVPKRGLVDVIYPLQRIRGRNYDILTRRRLPPYNGEVIGSTIFSISTIITNAKKSGIIK